MQDDSTNSESTFEFIDKKSEEMAAEVVGKSHALPSTSNSLLSNVPPPSALPSFVPVVSQPQMFHQPKSNPVSPTMKPTDGPAVPESSSASSVDNSADSGVNASNMFGWMKTIIDDTVNSKGSALLSKVAEKAKSSVGTVITTLDPQMKDFLSLSSSNELEIIVASDKEVKISPIREAFQSVIGKTNVRGIDVQPTGIASQPVGFEAVCKAACSRIESIRKRENFHGPVVAIENFIVQATPGKWFDVGYVVLNELEKGINLETFTQFTPVPLDIVKEAEDSTPKDYEHLSTGYAATIGSLMALNLQVSPGEWHYELTGITRRDMLLSAGRMIAALYKNTQF